MSNPTHQIGLEINTNSSFTNNNQPKLLTPININDPNNMLNSENYLHANSSQISGYSTQYSAPSIIMSNQTNHQEMIVITQTNHVQPIQNVAATNTNILNIPPPITQITLGEDDNENLDSGSECGDDDNDDDVGVDNDGNRQKDTSKDPTKNKDDTFTREDKKYMCKLCPYATDHNTNMKKHVKGHEPKEGIFKKHLLHCDKLR
jgi:hypothetical protein